MTETTTSQTVDWGDTSIQAPQRGSSRDLEKFFLDTNETARIVVMDKTAYLAMSHYKHDVRRYVRCIRDITGGACPGCEIAGEPRQRFGANVLQYKTTPTGEVIKPYEWVIKLWTFGPDKFTQLRAVREEWGDLRQRDLKVLCKSKQYQELVITPLKDTLWTSADAGIQDKVVEDYKEKRFDIEKIIGKIYSPDDMRSILTTGQLPESGRPESAPPPEVIQAAVADIEAELAGSETPAATTGEDINFDELLEDLT